MDKSYTYNELKESKLIYDRKPPAFGIIITLLTLIFVVSAIVWAGLSPKTYVVKAMGIVTSENKINVMNKVSGTIKEVRVYSGQRVEEGDILFVFDSFQIEIQIAQINALVDYYQGRIEDLLRLIIFVNEFTLTDPNTRINPFDNDNPNEFKSYSDAQILIDYVNNQEKAAQDEGGEFTQEMADSIKSQFVSQHYTTLSELQEKLVQQQSQLVMFQESIAEFIVKAEQNGILQLSSGVTIGTILQAGSLLGSISSDNNKTLYFDTIVNAADRSKIKVGDSVETVIAGVLQTEFGVIKGIVISIEPDSVQTEDGEAFFRIKIKPQKTFLENRKGNKVELVTGMLSESRVKYDETTWLKWMIEQIGVRFR